jgi:hypothetical protein
MEVEAARTMRFVNGRLASMDFSSKEEKEPEPIPEVEMEGSTIRVPQFTVGLTDGQPDDEGFIPVIFEKGKNGITPIVLCPLQNLNQTRSLPE